MNESISPITPDGQGQATIVEEKHSPAFHLFLYLVSFLSLGFLVTSIIGNLFQWVNNNFQEEELDRYSYMYDVDQGFLKFSISALLVAGPIYYGILYFLNKKLIKGEIAPNSLIRKFATYLAMFVFSAMGIGSLISLIYNYLDGELTSRSFLKIVIFFAVSAYFFAFYFWEIRRRDFSSKSFSQFLIVSIALGVFAFVIGFAIVDSPKVVRERKLDQEITSNMSSFQYRVEDYYRKNKQLPKGNEASIKVPEKVEYKVVSAESYQLCGEFKQEEKEDYPDDKWAHPKGTHCFDLDVKGIDTVPSGIKYDEGSMMP